MPRVSYSSLFEEFLKGFLTEFKPYTDSLYQYTLQEVKSLYYDGKTPGLTLFMVHSKTGREVEVTGVFSKSEDLPEVYYANKHLFAIDVGLMLSYSKDTPGLSAILCKGPWFQDIISRRYFIGRIADA